MTIEQDFISTHAMASCNVNANDLAEEFNGESGPAAAGIEWTFPDGSRATVVTSDDNTQEIHEAAGFV